MDKVLASFLDSDSSNDLKGKKKDGEVANGAKKYENILIKGFFHCEALLACASHFLNPVDYPSLNTKV
jgi:hypothetical protein